MQAMVPRVSSQAGDGSQAAATANQGNGAVRAAGGDANNKQNTMPSWPKLPMDPQQEMEQLRQHLEQWVRSVMTSSAREFNFSKDKATGELITRVVNPKTGALVRQVPSDISLHVQYWLQQVYGHDPAKLRGWSFSALA